MRDVSAYEMYLKSMKDVVYLSAEEEKELFAKARNGDKKARDKIISSALHFVIKIAKGFKVSGSLSLDDLIGYGNIGLVNAFEKYQENKGTRFITYACFWIRKEISDAVGKYARTVRLPQNCEEDLSRIYNIIEESEEKSSEKARIEEVAERLGMKESYVMNLINISGTVDSLDKPLTDSSTEIFTLGDKIPDYSAAKPSDLAEYEELNDYLSDMLDSLPEDERYVLIARNGYDRKGVRSYVSLGNELGVSKETVRTIERRALAHCRAYRNMKDFSIYVAA